MTETAKKILAQLSNVANGAGVILPLSLAVYPRSTICAAIEAFSESCELQLDEYRDGHALLGVRVKSLHTSDAHSIVGELQNFLLRSAVELNET